MPPVVRLDPRTASAAQSIWRDVSEDQFRKQIVALHRKLGEIPTDPKIHSAALWQKEFAHCDSHHGLLKFRDEQRLADDLAFVAAAKEDPKAVSAAVVEESSNSSGLTIRLAANDGIRPEVADTFRAICHILRECADKSTYHRIIMAQSCQALHGSSDISRQSCANALFDSVISLCEYRIHGRLESKHWRPPPHQPGREKKPLLQALRRFCLTLKSVRSNGSKSVESLRDQLVALCRTYEAVDLCSKDPSKRAAAIKLAVQKSHEVCTSGGKCSIEITIKAHGLDSDQICKEKVIRQMNKIGRYWGLCIDLAEDSRRYSALFNNISLDCLSPYTKPKSRVYAKTTPKGFVVCHVHAEIQLLVFLDQRELSESVRPRVIGVNKAACYLCNLFFLTHGKYFITKTHGRIHEQWTLPDLTTFNELQRREYRRIIANMTKVLKTTTKSGQLRKRVEPMQSYVCLPTPLDRSPLPSYAATIISDSAPNAVHPLKQNPPTPQASPIELTNAPKVQASLAPSVHTSPVQTSPAPQDHSGQNLQSSSRAQSPPRSSISTPSPPYNLDPEPRSTTAVQPYRSAQHLQSHSQTPSMPKTSISSLASLSAHSESAPGLLPTVPVQTSYQLPTPTESSSRTGSHQHLVPTNTSQAPRATAELHNPSNSSSSRTIALHPLHLPLTQTITSTHPLRLSFPALNITIEMDGSVSGKARISNPDAEDEIAAAVIDVDSLEPGESMTLVREEGASCVGMLLCQRRRGNRGEGVGCQLELSWSS